MTINVDFLATQISAWAWELGFQGVGITDTHLPEAEIHLQQWLTNNHHGAMSYMAHHGSKRSRPQELLPGTLRVISVRMNYWPQESVQEAVQQLENPEHGFISRYALGRDYHKLVRKRLQALADRISETVKEHHYRVYCDSAPVLEKALAEKSGLGWIGK
ncbi:MAG: DUF1730 domain-containing protein, partial [Gammaproteobacteria bacterium]|nr:DUF1730 domain-containing protein [Gammaproteobacteria bacterium]